MGYEEHKDLSGAVDQRNLYQVALIMPHNWWGVAGRRP